MSFISTYQYEQSSPRFECEDGEQIVAVSTAEATTSKNGSQMIKVGLKVSNSNGIIYFEHIVEGEFFNRKMSQFFDSFMIQPGNFDFRSWIGKKGLAMFTHKQETWTNNQGIQQVSNKAVLQYFISRKREEQTTPTGQVSPTVQAVPTVQVAQQQASQNPWAGQKSVTTDQLAYADPVW